MVAKFFGQSILDLKYLPYDELKEYEELMPQLKVVDKDV